VSTLEILHWNDVHGRWDALARLGARARAIRASVDHPVLLLDGGDVEEASVRLSALSHGVAGWRLLGAAGVDAAVAGNGGLLRYGPALLPRYADALGAAPLVCDLETLSGDTPEGAAPSSLLRAGDLLVGIIGITDYYHQYDVFGLRERGRVTAVRREAGRLRDAGADVVVVLSHAGINHDRGLSWSVRDKVDLIVGGHTHDVLTDGERDQGVPIAQAGSFGRYLGRILLEVDEAGARVVDMALEAVAEDAQADPAVLDALTAAEQDLERWLDEPVGHLPVAHAHDAAGESDAARLVCEALLAHRPADFALLIAAHCEGGLPAGRVRRRDVWATTSSPGNPATATLTGAQVRWMLTVGLSEEYAARTPRTFRGRALGRLQMVGISVEGDQITVGGRPLQDDHTYRVTGSDLELAVYGGLVTEAPADVEHDSTVILPEVLEAYLAGRLTAAGGEGSRAARPAGSPASR
jgi:2',3'-cyclic-nucleotide 2'-phosphodiesterase (5'-nucleotidase family)